MAFLGPKTHSTENYRRRNDHPEEKCPGNGTRTFAKRMYSSLGPCCFPLLSFDGTFNGSANTPRMHATSR